MGLNGTEDGVAESVLVNLTQDALGVRVLDGS
jgi:hypothetical protein